jgi:hypothetical protein
MRIAIVTILVACLFAGCTGSGMPGHKQGTLGEARVHANEAAADWADDAALMQVRGQELGSDEALAAFKEGAENKTERAQAVLDGNVGDGLAPAWRFRYASASLNATRDIVADAARVRAQLDRPDVGTGGGLACPIGVLPLDSPAIAEGGRSLAAFNQTASSADRVTMGVECINDDTFWMVFHTNGTDVLQAYFLSAETGEVVGVGLYAPGLGSLLPPEYGDDAGLATATAPVTFDITLTRAHPVLDLVLSPGSPPSNPSVPGTMLSISLTGPDGSSAQGSWTVLPTSDESSPIQLMDVEPGTYTAVVSVETGVASGFEMWWCTPTVFLFPGAMDNLACS